MHKRFQHSHTGVVFCPRNLSTFDGWQIEFDGALGLCINEDDPHHIQILIPEPATGLIHAYTTDGEVLTTYPTGLLGANDIQYVNGSYYVANTAQINKYSTRWALQQRYVLPQNSHLIGWQGAPNYFGILGTFDSYLQGFSVLPDGTILYERTDVGDGTSTVLVGHTAGAILGLYYGVFTSTGTHTFLSYSAAGYPETSFIRDFARDVHVQAPHTGIPLLVIPGETYADAGTEYCTLSDGWWYMNIHGLQDDLYPIAQALDGQPASPSGYQAFTRNPGNGRAGTFWFQGPLFGAPDTRNWGCVFNEYGERYEAIGQYTTVQGYVPYSPHPVTQVTGESYALRQSTYDPDLKTTVAWPPPVGTMHTAYGVFTVQAYLRFLGSPFHYGLWLDEHNVQHYWHDINGWKAYEYTTAQTPASQCCWGRIAWCKTTQSIYGILLASVPSFWDTPSPTPETPPPGPGGALVNTISTRIDQANFLHTISAVNTTVSYTRRQANAKASTNIPPMVLNDTYTDPTTGNALRYLVGNVSLCCDHQDILLASWEELDNNNQERCSLSMDGGTTWTLSPPNGTPATGL